MISTKQASIYTFASFMHLRRNLNLKNFKQNNVKQIEILQIVWTSTSLKIIIALYNIIRRISSE